MRSPLAKIELDAKRLGRDGFILVGKYDALTEVLELIQECFVKTKDRAERRVCEILIIELEPMAEMTKLELAALAQRRGALSRVVEDNLN